MILSCLVLSNEYFICISDRYVMLGNHRDAWVFGSLDPSSGTAAMMELSRAFGVMLKNGRIHTLN